jgi:hypothetical protein
MRPPKKKSVGAKLRNSRVAIMRARAHNLGTIDAPDPKAAENEAVKLFGLTEEQRKRLSIWERDLISPRCAPHGAMVIFGRQKKPNRSAILPSRAAVPCYTRPMPRRLPTPDRRRALELLAQCPQEGCSEALMRAHGFTDEQLVELVRLGLATATADRVAAGGRKFEVATLRIADAGRRALSRMKS